MTLPTFLFGFVLSSLMGAAFHLYRGGNAGRLLLYILMSWIGFWGGQFLSNLFGWRFLSLGPLNLGVAIPACLLFLLLGSWLSLVEPKKIEK